MEMENNLPENWELINLFEDLNFIPTGVLKYEGLKKYFSTGSIQDSNYIPEGQYNFENRPSRANREVKVNDVLQARMKNTDKGILIEKHLDGQLFSTGFIQLRPYADTYNSKLLYYLIRSDFFLNQKNEYATGSTQEALTDDGAKRIIIPLPPLAEQHRIVAKLDALFEKIESNKQRLEKIPKLLKRFRQSVLAAAVSGKLTEEWRKKNGINEEWKTMKATEACETVASGSTPKGKPFFEKEEIPYLKVYNIVNQQIDFFYKPQYIKREIHEKELKRCKVYPNDVIINIVGPPLGKVALIPDTFPEWNINQAIVVFRPKSILLSNFLYLILCDGKQIKDIELELRGTAGQSNISLSQCRDFDFSIPSLIEQTEIVRRVEQLFAFADRIEARYTKTKAMLDKLPQSILAKAFRGELVAQDPNDEPASVLLERIKAEKEKLKAKKKGKKTKEYAIEEIPLKIASEKDVKSKKKKTTK